MATHEEQVRQESLRNAMTMLLRTAVVVSFDKNGSAALCLVCLTKNKHSNDCPVGGVEAWARTNGVITT